MEPDRTVSPIPSAATRPRADRVAVGGRARGRTGPPRRAGTFMIRSAGGPYVYIAAGTAGCINDLL